MSACWFRIAFLHDERVRSRRSESYDDFGPVGDDPRWKSFGTLHSVLENLFPRVYAVITFVIRLI